MADTRLKTKIKTILKSSAFRDPDDAVYVSDGSDDNIHVVVVSEKFTGKRLRSPNKIGLTAGTLHK
jgi:stress-induced morphogen